MPIRRSPNGAVYTRPQPGRDRPEWVVAINRNQWSQSIGISGRNQPVRAYIASVTMVYQQVSGKALTMNSVLSHLPGFMSEAVLKRVLAAKGFKADENSMYIYKNVIQMIWPYDDRGRLVGEDVWEPDPDQAEIIKLDPADVLTTAQSAKLLAPLIKPLPSFDEIVLGKTVAMPKRA